MGEEKASSPETLFIQVVRTNGRAKRLADLMKQQDVILQNIAFSAYKTAYGLTSYEPFLIRRGTGHFDPSTDPDVLKMVARAEDSASAVIDDFRRLIDFSDMKKAKDQILFLTKNFPTLYSIEHGTHLHQLTARRLAQITLMEAAKIELRSKAGQQAARTAGPLLRKTVSLRANKRKSRQADRTAKYLIHKTEEIRTSLPEGQRNNKAAIARALQEAGIPTPSNKGRWQSTTVARIYERAGEPFLQNMESPGKDVPSSEVDEDNTQD